ncbi:hypothetical protein PVAND_011961 [Polypedilum vanderplanki]|uniref:Uncharacterized protein n=1 Tax=Polypedilum vanderplanki TaxID=319348 RepID=A0A9J6CLU8_POLVA|nr:hypothetical protein PVAND_011961 [Polypedilum vanderplanki]
MEPSQFINQTRLSKKQQQLQLHTQQSKANKFFCDSSHETNYHQKQQRCPFIPTAAITTPPITHFPGPPQDYHHHHYVPQQQQQQLMMSPHRRPQTMKKFHHQPDLNSIEVCIEYENQHNNVGVFGNNSNNKVPASSSIKWNRNNIAATMEKYEPTVKNHHNHRGHVTLSHQKAQQQFPMHNTEYLNEIHQMDYAYAYYEPGAPMRHQNIPDYYEEAGPSRAPPPNSIRALLSTARRNQLQRTSGKYSLPPSNNSLRSQENVYEEIHDNEKRRMRNGESLVSLDQNLVEEEFRRVHNRHQRILGELNLDVEEMLMPTALPQTNVNFIQTTPMLDPPSDSDPMDFLESGEVNDVSNGAGNNISGSNYVNNNIINNLDLDSGFSGSNSSYIGSLRYQKTNAAALGNKMPITQSTQLPINHQHTDSGSSSFYGGSSSSATDEIGMISLCRSSSSLYDSGKKSSKTSSPAAIDGKYHQQQISMKQGADKSDRISFWKTKGRGWISKLPGFSSTSSINKVGMGDFFLCRLEIK